MADPTRYRGERGREFGGDDRYGERGRDQGSDGGYIARRGFGNARAGYGPEERERGGQDRGGQDRGDDRRGGSDWGYPREEGRGYAGRGGGRERDDDRRDYGDAAGYGGGGSWRDFRDVTGRDWDDDRFRNPDEFFRGRDRERADRERGGNDYSGRFRGDQGYGREGRGGGDERGFLERAGDEIASWFGDDEAARRRAQDAGQEGSGYGHRGRGPRNYRRSDERIREDVSDRLMEDPHVDASDVEVGVANGEVVLTGTVDSRFAKRHAEDLAASVAGVTHVQNNLRVAQQGSSQGGQGVAGSPEMGRSAAAGLDSGLLAGGGMGGGRTRRKPSAGQEGTTDLGRASEGTVTGRLGSPGGSRRTRGGRPTE